MVAKRLNAEQEMGNMVQLSLKEKLAMIRCLASRAHLTLEECKQLAKIEVHQYGHKKFTGMLG